MERSFPKTAAVMLGILAALAQVSCGGHPLERALATSRVSAGAREYRRASDEEIERYISEMTEIQGECSALMGPYQGGERAKIAVLDSLTGKVRLLSERIRTLSPDVLSYILSGVAAKATAPTQESVRGFIAACDKNPALKAAYDRFVSAHYFLGEGASQ